MEEFPSSFKIEMHLRYLFVKPINSTKSYLFLLGKKKRMYLILMLTIQVRPKLRYFPSITVVLTRQWPIVLRQYLRYYIYNLFILWYIVFQS